MHHARAISVLVALAFGFVLVFGQEPLPKITIPKRVTDNWLAAQNPKLPKSVDLYCRFYVDSLKHDNPEKLELLPAIAALYTNPYCKDMRPRDAENGARRIEGAVRERKYENRNLVPSGFVQQVLFNADSLSSESRDSRASLLDQKHIDELKSFAKEALERTKTWDKYWKNPYAGLQIGLAINDQLGENFYQLKRVLDQDALRELQRADQICRPEKSEASLLYRPDADAAVNACRVIAAHWGKDTLMKSVLSRKGQFAFGLDPTKSLDDLVKESPENAKAVYQFRATQPKPRLDSKSADHRKATEKSRPPGSTVGDRRKLDKEQEKQVRILTNRLQKYREVDRDLAAKVQEAKNRPSKTPEDAKDNATEIEKLTEKRLNTLKEARYASRLALDVLADVGLDPNLVRDLSKVTNSGFQISEGIISVIPDLANPVGWLNILGGLSSLLGGFGPNPYEMIFEQLREIRRDLAEFRHEVRVQFALLRMDLLSSTQKLLDRVENFEYNLARELEEIKNQVRWNEYRLGQVEGQIAVLSHQILTRFAELHQKDIVTLLSRRDLLPTEFSRLDDPANRSEQLVNRYMDALSVAYAAAVHHSVSRTMAGGDSEVPAAYGVAPVRLSVGYTAALLPMVQQAMAPWSNTNDFVSLARTAGTELLPQTRAEARSSGLAVERRLLPLDRTRVVNPHAWSLAASAYLGLATSCPEYFKSRPELSRGLADIYLRGEEFNEAVNRIAPPTDGGVFRALMECQLAAVRRLDAIIRNGANKVARNLNGINPWHPKGAKQDPPASASVEWLGTTPNWQDRLQGTQFDGLGMTFSREKLIIDDSTCKRLIKEGLVPRAYAIASMIRPDLSKGGSQAYFGGRIEFYLVDIEVPRIVHGSQRRQSTGFLGTGEGKYHDLNFYDSPVWVTFEARYKSPSSAYDEPIFRKRVPTRQNYRFSYDAEFGIRFFSNPDSFQKVVEVCRRVPYLRSNEEIDFSFFGMQRIQPAPTKGFNPAGVISDPQRWKELVEDLFQRDRGEMFRDMARSERVEETIKDRLEAEIQSFAESNDESLKKGLNEIGETVREVVGCQWTHLRFLELGVPEALQDEELIALVIGKESAWGGTSVMERFRSAPDKVPPMIEDKTDYTKPDDKRVFLIDVPLTRSMLAQTIRLQAKLAEVLARHRSLDEPFRHTAVEGTLLRIAFVARQLKIDLGNELAQTGPVPAYWTISEVNRLSDLAEKGEQP